MFPDLSFALPFIIASLITKVNAPFCHPLDSSADYAPVATEISIVPVPRRSSGTELKDLQDFVKQKSLPIRKSSQSHKS